MDIMDEAVEICKLRLFLKLIAQVDDVAGVEPLPDIDFNIRAGNTLVGFAAMGDVRKTVSGLGFAGAEVEQLEEEAQVADKAFQEFRRLQTAEGVAPQEFAVARQELRERLRALDQKLNEYLAGDYSIADVGSPGTLHGSERTSLFTGWCISTAL